MGEKQNDEGTKGKSKKPKNKEPWFDDPYDNELPWGAPIVTAKEISDALDKAPPFGYFKEKVKELPKAKRKRRKKNEWDDLFKDPLTGLRKGLDFLKQREETPQEPRVSTMDKELEKCIEEEIATYDKDGVQDKPKANIVSESTTSIDQKGSSSNEKQKLNETSKLQDVVSSSSTVTDTKIDRKSKKSKERKYKSRIEELSKELEDLKVRLKALTEAVTSATATKNVNSNNIGVTNTILNGNTVYTNEHFQKTTGTASGARGETIPLVPKTENPLRLNVTSSENVIDTIALVENTEPKHSKTKEKVASPPSPGTIRKNKIKAIKRKKRKAKERKEIKEIFDDPFFKDEKNSDTEIRNKPHTITDHHGYNQGPSINSMSASNNMHGVSPFALDDEPLFDPDHSTQQLHSMNVSRFTDSTLKPGDGYILQK